MGVALSLLPLLLRHPVRVRNSRMHTTRPTTPTAYQLAGPVLRRVTATIEAPISAMLNKILAGTFDGFSEIAEHVYPLIYELHIISASLLNRVIPNICLQLQVEEEDIRLKAVKLLGKLFASTHADYAQEFEHNFMEYVSYCGDLSTEIRLEEDDDKKEDDEDGDFATVSEIQW